MRAESRRDLSTGQPGFDGRLLPGLEVSFQPGALHDICKRIWGDKPDAKIAAIIGCSDRMVRDYLSERADPPPQLFIAILLAITPRRRKRGRRQ